MCGRLNAHVIRSAEMYTNLLIYSRVRCVLARSEAVVCVALLFVCAAQCRDVASVCCLSVCVVQMLPVAPAPATCQPDLPHIPPAAPTHAKNISLPLSVNTTTLIRALLTCSSFTFSKVTGNCN